MTLRPIGQPAHHSVRVTRAVALLVCAAVLMLSAGCGGSGIAAQELLVTGSTTLLPIAEISGEMYGDRNPDVRVLVSGLGSSAGIESVSKGSSDIGTSSRDLKPEEESLGLYDTPVAFDAITVIVNPDNPVDELTTDQVRLIFNGTYTNWSDLGGPDMPIGLVNRDEASGTREAFYKIVMEETPFDRTAAVLPGTGQVRSVVAEAPGAIGYISLGFVNDEVKMLAIDGVLPSEASVVDGSYPIQRLLHFYTVGAPTGDAADFIEFVLSEEIQSGLVREAGFTPVTGAGE